MGVEIYAKTDESRLPDPQRDELSAVFYSVYLKGSPDKIRGVILKANLNEHIRFEQSSSYANIKQRFKRVRDVMLARDEVTLIKLFVLVVISYDADLMWGHETQKYSIEFIRQRSVKKGF